MSHSHSAFSHILSGYELIGGGRYSGAVVESRDIYFPYAVLLFDIPAVGIRYRGGLFEILPVVSAIQESCAGMGIRREPFTIVCSHGSDERK